MVHIRNILVPCDETALSEKALAVALTMADRFESRIVLLHVRPDTVRLDPLVFDSDISDVDVESESLLGIARRVMKEAGMEMPPGRLTAEVRTGRPEAAIAASAEENLIDLIVMGTHGRQGLSEVFTGSTTERVLQLTSASLLVVRAEGFPYLRE